MLFQVRSQKVNTLEMSVSYFIKVLMFLLPIAINCQGGGLEKGCIRIDCTKKTSNATPCYDIDHLPDPFTNQCVAKCDGPCIDGYCEHCYCKSTDTDAIHSAEPSECKRVLNGTYCRENECVFKGLQSCNNNYIINPISISECVLRCDSTSCEYGVCINSGHCVCNFGYRPDIVNPRVCVKIPDGNRETCQKGFKLENGECTSVCGDCKNGGCDADGVCRCWENFRMNVTTSTCVPIDDTTSACLPVDNITPTYELVDNTTFKTSSTEDIILRATHNTYITIIGCVITVLLFTAIVLIFIDIKLRHALPL